MLREWWTSFTFLQPIPEKEPTALDNRTSLGATKGKTTEAKEAFRHHSAYCAELLLLAFCHWFTLHVFFEGLLFRIPSGNGSTRFSCILSLLHCCFSYLFSSVFHIAGLDGYFKLPCFAQEVSRDFLYKKLRRKFLRNKRDMSRATKPN